MSNLLWIRITFPDGSVTYINMAKKVKVDFENKAVIIESDDPTMKLIHFSELKDIQFEAWKVPGGNLP